MPLCGGQGAIIQLQACRLETITTSKQFAQEAVQTQSSQSALLKTCTCWFSHRAQCRQKNESGLQNRSLIHPKIPRIFKSGHCSTHTTPQEFPKRLATIRRHDIQRASFKAAIIKNEQTGKTDLPHPLSNTCNPKFPNQPEIDLHYPANAKTAGAQPAFFQRLAVAG
jgi:hypothetical protein